MDFTLPKKPENCLLDLRAYAGFNNLAINYNSSFATGEISTNIPQINIDENGIPYFPFSGSPDEYIKSAVNASHDVRDKFSLELIFSIEEDMYDNYNYHGIDNYSSSLWYLQCQNIFTSIGWAYYTLTLSHKICQANKIYQFVYTFDGTQFINYLNKEQIYIAPKGNSINDYQDKNNILINAKGDKPIKIYGYRFYNEVLTLKDISYNYELITGNLAENNTVVIKNNAIKQLPSDHGLIGTNFPGWGTRYTFKDIRSQDKIELFATYFKKMGISTLRYPQGFDMMLFFWDIPFEQLMTGIANWADYPEHGTMSIIPEENMWTIYEHLEFCKKYNFKTIIPLNNAAYFDKNTNIISYLKATNFDSSDNETGNGSINWNLVDLASNSAKELVQYVYDNDYQDIIAYWEIGNEDWGYSNGRARYFGWDYAQVADIFIQKIRQVDSDAKIIVTFTEGRLEEWSYYAQIRDAFGKELVESNCWQKYLEDENIYYGPHFYYPVPTYNGTMTNPTFTTTLEKIADQTLNGNNYQIRDFGYKTLLNAGVKNPKLIVGEFNSYAVKHKYNLAYLSFLGIARQIISALNTAGYIHFCQYEAINGMAYRLTTFDGGVNQAMGALHTLNYLRPEKAFVMHPVGYCLQLFNIYIYKNILEIECPIVGCEILATKDDSDKMSFIILNFNEETTVTLDFSDEYEIKKDISISDVALDWYALNIGDNALSPSTINRLPLKFNQLEYSGNNVILKENSVNIILLDK